MSIAIEEDDAIAGARRTLFALAESSLGSDFRCSREEFYGRSAGLSDD
jgi:hypothetical protein